MRLSPARVCAVVLLVAGGGAVSAQEAWIAQHPGLPGPVPVNQFGIALPTAGIPAGGANVFGARGYIRGNAPAPLGGHACDPITGRFFTSDGSTIFDEPMQSYPGLGFSTTPMFAGTANPPNVTGLAMDPVAGVLYMCDLAGLVTPLVPAFPFPPLGPSFLIPGIGVAPPSGLGFDSATGLLWACDVAGGIYSFTPGGAPAGGVQPVATVSVAAAPLVGLAVNEANGVGSVPPPACSTQALAPHVMVTDGLTIRDALNGAVPAIAMPSAGPPGPGTTYGMTYSNDPQTIAVNACHPSFAGIRVTRPTYNGPSPMLATVDLVSPGNPASGTLATLMVDLCPIPQGPIALPSASAPGGMLQLAINPFSPTMVMVPALVGPGLVASIPLPLQFAPTGLQFSVQWFWPDPASQPLSVCLSNALSLTVGRP